MRLVLMILFVVATTVSTFAQGNGLENGRVYTGYQVRVYGIEKWGAAFPSHQYDATKHYTYNAHSNQFEEYCPTCITTPTVVTPPPVSPPVIIQQQQGCSDCISVDQALRLVEENRRMAETILKYQQQGGGGNQGGGMSQAELYAYERQFAIAEEQLRIQKRQGIGNILVNTFFGLGNLGMQGWNNWNVGRGKYQSILTTNVFQQGGSGGTFTPDDRLPVGVGGGNNNSNLDPFYPNFSGQNGTSGASFSNNNSSNQGFIPGDNNPVGSRYVYRQSR